MQTRNEETLEERDERLHSQRIRQTQYRNEETKQEREIHLYRQKERQRQLRNEKTAEETNTTHFPVEFLDSLELSGLPPHRPKLEFKKRFARLCNDTRLIVEDLKENLIVAKIITSAFKDEIVLIPRIKHVLSEIDGIPLESTKSSVPSSVMFWDDHS